MRMVVWNPDVSLHVNIMEFFCFALKLKQNKGTPQSFNSKPLCTLQLHFKNSNTLDTVILLVLLL